MNETYGQTLEGIELNVAGISTGLFSNNLDLISSKEYFGGTSHPAVAEGMGWQIHSQEANIRIATCPLQDDADLKGSFSILDQKDSIPAIEIREERITACGDWSRLEEETIDRRYSLLGNQGVLFRYLLTVLERHGIYSFHACGLVEKESGTTCLVLGERGSGKSALLLAALASGRFLSFGTEIVHAGLDEDGLCFYRSSLRNNVRLGHMIYDFPRLAEEIGVSFSATDDPWNTKVQLDFSQFAVTEDKISGQQTILVIPRIEEEVSQPMISRMAESDLIKLKRSMVENISDKICSLALIYETVPVGTLDNPGLMKNRISFVDDILRSGNIVAANTVFASPLNCLEGLNA